MQAPLAYIVDADPGRPSEAVATNSCFHGISAFVFMQAAAPLRDSIGRQEVYIHSGLDFLSSANSYSCSCKSMPLPGG
jgi:hypothetical protein